MARAVPGCRLLLITHDDAAESLKAGIANSNLSAEERRDLTEAILLSETDLDDNGTMGVRLLLAGHQARTKELEALTADEFRAECREVLADLDERQRYWRAGKKHRARLLKAKQQQNEAALFELARFYRSQGAYADQVFAKVKATPFVASNGDIVKVCEPHLIVLRNTLPIGRPVSLNWFRNHYWPKATRQRQIA